MELEALGGLQAGKTSKNDRSRLEAAEKIQKNLSSFCRQTGVRKFLLTFSFLFKSEILISVCGMRNHRSLEP